MSNHDAFVRDSLDLMEQMRGDDDAVALVPIGAKRFGQRGYAIGVQAVLRLVEDRNLGCGTRARQSSRRSFMPVE